MPYKDPIVRKRKAHERYLKRADVIKARVRIISRPKRAESKQTVLEHYGKEGKARCCWSQCSVDDVDMLSIDHIKNNGAEHRKEMSGSSKGMAGAPFYRKLIREGFPEGYQTLCLNHQFKKELLRKRAAWETRVFPRPERSS
jgi:hypothetical protein